MEVILLERVAKLGQMGDVVRVKDGFARNFLLPKGKALRATEDNRSRFEGMKAELEARNLELKGEAEKVAEKLDGKSFIVIRQASETGQLFGSVSPRDIASMLERRRLHRQPQPDRAQRADQDDRQHKVPWRCIRRSRSRSPSSSRATPTRRAHRARRGRDGPPRQDDEEDAAAKMAAEAFFEPEAAAARGRWRRERRGWRKRNRLVREPGAGQAAASRASIQASLSPMKPARSQDRAVFCRANAEA